MALNFPDSPTLNQIYTDATSGFSYQWDGVVWQSYTPFATKNITVLDDISGSFDGLTTNFNLTDSGTAVTPVNSQQLRVTLGGIVQKPGTDYLVAGSTIIFTTAPGAGLDCSIVSLGPAAAIGVPGDGTVTPTKLSTGGPSWNTSGDVYIAGITTITNSSGTVIAGIGTTALIVEGNARVTGILTIGTSSITLDGTNNQINVGTGLTLTSGGIVVGVVTATTFDGSLGNVAEKINDIGNTGTSSTIDLNNGNFVTGVLTGNCTFTFSNPTTGASSFTLLLTNDGTAGRSITWPASVKWPGGSVPTRTTDANKTDVYTFFTTNSGTNWYGNLAQYNYS